MIAAGFGFRATASVESLADALARAAGERPVSVLATADDKARAEVFERFARRLGLRVYGVDSNALGKQQTFTRSKASIAARSAGSVAEAAALAAVGEGARLLAPRVISADGLATCALAEGNGQ